MSVPPSWLSAVTLSRLLLLLRSCMRRLLPPDRRPWSRLVVFALDAPRASCRFRPRAEGSRSALSSNDPDRGSGVAGNLRIFVFLCNTLALCGIVVGVRVKRSAEAQAAPALHAPAGLNALFDAEYEAMYRLAFAMLDSDRDAEEAPTFLLRAGSRIPVRRERRPPRGPHHRTRPPQCGPTLVRVATPRLPSPEVLS